MTPLPPETYDPDFHDSHVVGLYRDDAAADLAREALLGAGVLSERIEVMTGGTAWQETSHPVRALFVPEDDYHDFHHALVRGHALVVVRPLGAVERDAAVMALERAAPIDIDTNGRHWRGVGERGPARELNHATVSRADLRDRRVGGRDEVMLDMTGQKMRIRVLSQADMQAAPFAPTLDPAERPAPLAPPAPAREQEVTGTTYTYGVPAQIVRRMTPEEQVLAQSPGQPGALGRYLSGERLGWRDRHAGARHVRSYLVERALRT